MYHFQESSKLESVQLFCSTFVRAKCHLKGALNQTQIKVEPDSTEKKSRTKRFWSGGNSGGGRIREYGAISILNRSSANFKPGK